MTFLLNSVSHLTRSLRSRGCVAVLLGGILLTSSGAGLSNAATTPTVKKRTTSTTTKPKVTSPIVPAKTPKTTMGSVRSAVSGSASGPIINVWIGAKVDPAKLPIGDDSVTTSGAGVGKLFACRAGNPNAPGASADGPWINADGKTWNSTTKLAVKGEVSWPSAKYSETVSEGNRVLISNNLPVDMKSGTFPIAPDDPSYAYDRNPGRISETDTTFTFVQAGTVAAKATCLSEGPVGMLKNGVRIFNAIDARGNDAVAHESQDLCQGHPAMTTYHYHNVPLCLRNAATGASVVVGWMADGFPIVVERDASGALPTNAELDECHGRTSPILLDGKVVTQYHYSATLEFPYSIGCYKGTPKNLR